MKIRIIVNPELTENEVTIHCNKVDSEIAKIQNAISTISAAKEQLIFYKGDTEYYLSLDKILFLTDYSSFWIHKQVCVFPQIELHLRRLNFL